MNMNHIVYKILVQPSGTETKVRGSRFIARAQPASSREKAEAFIEAIKKDQHDASHHCFAYRIGLADNATSRYYDDGEPSGTAGKPILAAIDAAGLTDTVLVVTRYFGGTKLGTGGLARAYGHAARLALENARIETRTVNTKLCLSYDYPFSAILERLFETYHVCILEAEYRTTITQTVHVRADWTADFIKAVIDATSNHVEVKKK